MLRELLSFFRSTEPLQLMGESFSQMLESSYHLTREAGEIFWLTQSAGSERLGAIAVHMGRKRA